MAGIGFAGTSLCGALAWRAALRASGSPLTVFDATTRYAVGCGVNAIAPAHVGSALRVALFGRVTKGGCWTVSGAAAAVGVTRIVWLGVADHDRQRRGRAPALAALRHRRDRRRRGRARVMSRRVALPRRIEQLLAAFRSLAASPRDLGIVSGWALVGAATKVAAAAAVVGAFGIDHPLRAALVLVPAVELAAVLPITPGNVGLASAAVALALGSQGVDSKTALSAGIAFGAVELLTGMVIGAAGALSLRAPPHARTSGWPRPASPRPSWRSPSARRFCCPPCRAAAGVVGRSRPAFEGGGGGERSAFSRLRAGARLNPEGGLPLLDG